MLSNSMPPPRSTDPFAPVSRSSTGSRHNGNSGSLPSYPKNTTTDYYNTDEKSRRHATETSGGELPPSYEEAAGPRTAKKEYPREKQTAAQSQQQYIEEHKSRHSSSHSGTHRSRSTREGETGHRSSREHRSGSERHRSDRHRSDRHRSDREHKSRSSKSKEKDSKPAKNVDTIDKLDVTGLFGGAFHHDGPFDACTPHRNKDQKSAPVLAFPADGPNNSIRGTANVNKDATLRYIQGREDEEDDDLYAPPSTVAPRNTYARGANGSDSTLAAVKNDVKITSFDAKGRATPVHGETTLGLGSTTFLDGAPAAQSAIAEEANKNSSGLGRKKSIKQRIRGDSYTSPQSQPAKLNMPSYNRANSADALQVESGNGNSLLKRVKSLKVGRSRS